uniref:Uncharacterized protein n=1 Tax=Chelonoidis abingdonii TaxID=106734 RepID=A0A8C0ILW9_CHEAB
MAAVVFLWLQNQAYKGYRIPVTLIIVTLKLNWLLDCGTTHNRYIVHPHLSCTPSPLRPVFRPFTIKSRGC